MRVTVAAPSLRALLLGAVAPAAALDQPLRGDKLSLRRTAAGKEKLVFVSRSIAATVPAPGSPDDPAVGTPGGATIALFSGSEDAVALVVPSGAGRPGWEVQASRARYGNPDAPAGPTPVRLVSMQSERRLKIVARATGLSLGGPQGRVGIRVTTGSLRQCALFEGASVRVDQAGEFLAGQTSTPSFGFLPDCSDATLAGAPAPCTDGTFPVTGCGGTCPAGSTCGTQDLNACVCISEAEPCGDTYPACHGQCPAGEECNYFELSTPGASGCECGPPGPCGFGGDDCPAGFRCVGMPGIPGISFFCAPL